MDFKPLILRNYLGSVTFVLTEYNDVIDVDDIYIAPVIITNKEEDDHIIEYMKNLKLLKDKEGLYELYNLYSRKIGKISRLAEIIDKDLETILELYIKKNKLSEVLARDSRCEKINKELEFFKYDFFQRSRLFSCILNSDKIFHSLESFNSKQKRKVFTKILDQYITERNYYTHGALFIEYPSYKPMLVIKEKSEKKIVTIESSIIANNLQKFVFLRGGLKSFINLLLEYH